MAGHCWHFGTSGHDVVARRCVSGKRRCDARVGETGEKAYLQETLPIEENEKEKEESGKAKDLFELGTNSNSSQKLHKLQIFGNFGLFHVLSRPKEVISCLRPDFSSPIAYFPLIYTSVLLALLFRGNGRRNSCWLHRRDPAGLFRQVLRLQARPVGC